MKRNAFSVASVAIAALAMCLTGCSVGNDRDMNEVVEGYGYTVTVTYDAMGGLWSNRYDVKTVKAMPNTYLPEPGVSSASGFPYPVKSRGTIAGWYVAYTSGENGIVWNEDDRWDFRADRAQEDTTLYCRWDTVKRVAVHQDDLVYYSDVEQGEDGRYLWVIPSDSPISSAAGKTFSHYSLERDGAEPDYVYIDGGRARAVDLTALFADGDDADIYVVWRINYVKVGTYAELSAAAAASANIYLTADIDMGGRTSPFAQTDYSGVFNGGGHTIYNCKITAANGFYGFFGSLTDATVTGLRLENVTVNVSSKIATGRAAVGVLAGGVYVGNTIGDIELVSCSVTNGLTALVRDNWTVLSGGWYGEAVGVSVENFGVSGEVEINI